MQYRDYGQTGIQLSIVGFGGILVTHVAPEEVAPTVSRAVDRGINYFDVAPTYGTAEERLGPALAPYRSRVFLACKTEQRRRADAQEALENSLRLLHTDYFDLYQLHAMTTADDVEQAMGPGGSMEALVRAREKGQVRFLGFSAHSEEAALQLLDLYPFDSILFPVNWVTYMAAGFGPAVMEKAEQKGVARLALKPMARGRWENPAAKASKFPASWYDPCTDPEEAELALRFALSEPITSSLPPGHPELFWHGVDCADRFEPLSYAEREALHRRAAGVQALFPLVQ